MKTKNLLVVCAALAVTTLPLMSKADPAVSINSTWTIPFTNNLNQALDAINFVSGEADDNSGGLTFYVESGSIPVQKGATYSWQLGIYQNGMMYNASTNLIASFIVSYQGKQCLVTVTDLVNNSTAWDPTYGNYYTIPPSINSVTGVTAAGGCGFTASVSSNNVVLSPVS